LDVHVLHKKWVLLNLQVVILKTKLSVVMFIVMKRSSGHVKMMSAGLNTMMNYMVCIKI
jgi:hypothetical protein